MILSYYANPSSEVAVTEVRGTREVRLGRLIPFSEAEWARVEAGARSYSLQSSDFVRETVLAVLDGAVALAERRVVEGDAFASNHEIGRLTAELREALDG